MATMEKLTPRSNSGKWKNRFGGIMIGGTGRRNSKKGLVILSATPPPEEPDNGEARSLQAKKNQRLQAKPDKKRGGSMIRMLQIKTSFRKQESRDASESSPSNPQSPYSNDSYITVDESDLEEKKVEYDMNDPKQRKQMQDRKNQQMIYHKQRLKERDGFCRRVDTYDGNVIVVDQKPTYEIGNYLGGGVAGVVYQGHRLRPLNEYPIRSGINDNEEEGEESHGDDNNNNDNNRGQRMEGDAEDGLGAVFFCGPVNFEGAGDHPLCGEDAEREDETVTSPMSSTLMEKTKVTPSNNNNPGNNNKKGAVFQEAADVAIEATMTANENVVMLDGQDAPSRSQHFRRAAGVKVEASTFTTNKHHTQSSSNNNSSNNNNNKNLIHGLTDEAVAIKILNPVGYRILQSDGMKGTVVIKKGDPMDADVKKGVKPMSENHVWWMVNPNSRNLRTLQRYNGKDKNNTANKSVQVDRGTKDKGLRLSLIAAYVDPRTNQLRELTLTRCIEIWGHIPFNATDVEFEDMMTAIERVNAGQAPPPMSAFPRATEGQDEKDGTVTSNSVASAEDPLSPVSFQAARTGLLRAALSHRTTVYCEELNAHIAIPAVPTKYLRWLRQRRAATKEVRNMMLIGRHKNVLHLFEVLEYIQESKSTMFLILELVKGGELFDLISSSAGKNRKKQEDSEEAEQMMRKYFYELASGINYCHKNGIAHRDLKPENLLVHNTHDGQSTLKIADFGLSAAFGANSRTQISDNDAAESLGSPLSQQSQDGESAFSPKGGDSAMSPSSQMSINSMKDSMDKLIASGANALSFLTCGAMETVLCIPSGSALANGPLALRRMTSIVGSPHYVAPEIISQNEDKGKRGKSSYGYDGAKADVWSAGVILYAMLFRSLPFGEDLLRCPRFQSYRKWYDEVRELCGRRSSAAAALNPHISASDERDLLGPHWFFPAATSKESRDLIVAMLNPKPEDRLSVAQVLEHPWVRAIANKS